MNLREAEAIKALSIEIDSAGRLEGDEELFRADLRLQLAGERVVERVFQAAEAIPADRREAYFGADGARQLRGMRNRLAHNYLEVDVSVLVGVLKDDLPEVARRMAADLQVAEVVLASRSAKAVDDQAWVGSHLSALNAPDDV